MASLRTGPCNWDLAHCGEVNESTPGECSSLGALTPEMRVLVQDMARAYLWNWTKQQFGTCPVTVRPCRKECTNSEWSTYRGRAGYSYLPWTEGNPGPLNPALFNGQWYNLGCGGACNNDPCSCSYVPTIDLLGPVASIEEIRIDGVVMDASRYRIDNYRYLVRVDGDDWPVCQNMLNDPMTDDDTMLVTYNIGVDVPAGGQIAAGRLACEIAKLACSDSSCKLPQRVQSISRQGVNTTLLDSFEMMYKMGTTGLTLVDMWVASVNAPIAKSGYRVASPDRRSTRRTTG